MKTIPKGHFGYLKSRQKSLLIKVVILAVGCFGIILIGYLVTHTKANWMTIFGCLTAIPLAMTFATYVAVCKFKGPSEKEYEEIKFLVGSGVLDTELIIANKDGKSFQFHYAFVHETGMYLYTPDLKMDLRKTESYIRNYLRLNSCDGELTIYNNMDSYKRKLSGLTASDRETCDEHLLKQEGILLAISM